MVATIGNNRAMKSIRSIAELQDAGIIQAVEPDLKQVETHFATAISAPMLEQMQYDVSDPVYQQFVPDVRELNIAEDELEDPIGDLSHSPVEGLVHRHADRVLLMPVNVCAVYCRFCFRREHIGPNSAAMTPEQLDAAYDYIASHPQIREVIFTGGDPLMLKPQRLKVIISRLTSIAHVDVIRLHTRIPVVEPARINSELLSVLADIPVCYVVIHANHRQEFTAAADQACEQLRRQGVVLLSQSVLLKNINDNIEALSQLMRHFVGLGIKPYYLHQLDKARGTSHFAVDIAKGRKLMRQMREQLSGLCQPTYVLDEPGGVSGKQPL